MTAFDYARPTATADKLIKKFGQTGAIRRITNSGTSYEPTQTTIDYACTLVDLDFEDSRINGTTIKRGDRMVYVSALGLAIDPTIADKVIIGSVEYSIVNVTRTAPAGSVVLYELTARR